jgi:hypothetical protein
MNLLSPAGDHIGQSNANSLFNPRIVAAASLLPPPKPAPIGIRF